MRRALTAEAAVLAGISGYLLALLGAATRDKLRPEPQPGPAELRFTVLVPAHDEQGQIARCLESLEAQRYAGRFEIVVIADNCTDRTAEVAAARGATVWERREPIRGKGAALAWALDRLFDASERPDAVAVVDADCAASDNLLDTFSRFLADGAAAVQACNVVANPTESWASAVRYSAFVLMNTVRPRGKRALGLSCGLLGTGMGFSVDLLARVPWNAFGITEDGEYHLTMVAAGERVLFVPDSVVTQPMPTSFSGSEIQQARWERGRFALALRRAPRLMLMAIADRDVVKAHAAFEVAVPPQTLLFGAGVAVTAAGRAFRHRPAYRLGSAALAGQAAFAVGGLALAGAPARAYAALALAPLLAVRKVALVLRVARGRTPPDWVRAPRG